MGSLKLPILLFLNRFEILFTNAAKRANPIFRYIFKSGSGRNATIRIPYRGIINITTYCANVLFHSINI